MVNLSFLGGKKIKSYCIFYRVTARVTPTSQKIKYIKLLTYPQQKQKELSF